MSKDLMTSQLPTATELDGEELVAFAKGGGNGSFPVSLLKSHIREGLATAQSVTDLQNAAAATYATKGELPDLTDVPTRQNYEQLLAAVASLTQQVATLQAAVNAIPAIPLSDGKTYAVKDGAWEVIADATENISVVTNDLSLIHI